MLTPEQISKLPAKQQLACGEITVEGKQVPVPEWLFDLATRKDSYIFNTQICLEESKTQVEKMSKAMFTNLLIKLHAKNK